MAFAAGLVDVLVTTTVVEVGVDVPNATAMVIMDADRFGVSQLHQLRGRVGRGSHEGLCLLVTEAEAGSPSRQRLDAVAATLDGFELSRLDLEQRREGDVLGAAQAGRRSSLKLLTLLADEDLDRPRPPRGHRPGGRRPGPGWPARAGRRGRRAARIAAGGVPGEGLSGQPDDAHHRRPAGGGGWPSRPARAPGPPATGPRGPVRHHHGILDLRGHRGPRPVRRVGRGRPGGAVPRRGGRAADRGPAGAPG